MNKEFRRFSEAKKYLIQRFERRYLRVALLRAAGNISAAARLSGTERRQFGKLIKKHGLDREALALEAAEIRAIERAAFDGMREQLGYRSHVAP